MAADQQQVMVDRQHLLDQYRYRCLNRSSRAAELGPCRDPLLLERAHTYLLTASTRGVFTLFPFYQTLSESPGPQLQHRDQDQLQHRDQDQDQHRDQDQDQHRDQDQDQCDRKYLKDFIKATEMLETLCVFILHQPWRKDIRTIKTFTAAYVYHLLPVLSSSTLHSVLASIGYLPDPQATPSEFRLREEVDMDRVVLLGFELMLSRLQCLQLLKQLEREDLDSPAHMTLSRILQRDQPTNQREPLDEEEVEEQRIASSPEEEVLLHLDSEVPEDSPPRAQLQPISVDHSIMEMQRTYPDLAFRGRRLLGALPSRAHSCRRTDVPQKTSKRTDSSCGGPQTMSLHITLRAGSTAGGRETLVQSEESTGEEEELKRLADRMGGGGAQSSEEEEKV